MYSLDQLVQGEKLVCRLVGLLFSFVNAVNKVVTHEPSVIENSLRLVSYSL